MCLRNGKLAYLEVLFRRARALTFVINAFFEQYQIRVVIIIRDYFFKQKLQTYRRYVAPIATALAADISPSVH